jgi:hypothetical protein
MTRLLLLLLVVLLAACSKEPDRECSATCIGEGLAISADACSSEVLRYESCKAPELVRDPVAGELVTVRSSDEERQTIVLSVTADGEFVVGGPPAAAELGSSVEAVSDGALLGLVQSFSGSSSTCSAP